MKGIALAVGVCLTAAVAAAEPLVTNQDTQPYQLHMDCKHISSSLAVMADDTVKLESFKVGSNCILNVYPYEDPYGKDGNYDLKKRFSSAKLKKDSECVIKNRRVACE